MGLDSQGQCASCHSGTLLSDQHFHKPGVPQRDKNRPDRRRAAALAKVRADEFNCLGRYRDTTPAQCGELSFIIKEDASLEGAFKTPACAMSRNGDPICTPAGSPRWKMLCATTSTRPMRQSATRNMPLQAMRQRLIRATSMRASRCTCRRQNNRTLWLLCVRFRQLFLPG